MVIFNESSLSVKINPNKISTTPTKPLTLSENLTWIRGMKTDTPSQSETRKSNHTLGPWKTGSTHCDSRNRSFSTAIYAPSETGSDRIGESWASFEGSRFLTKRTSDQARVTSLANAKLMAAAPELLKEMERYLPVLERLEKMAQWDSCTEGLGIATANGFRNAINKAK